MLNFKQLFYYYHYYYHYYYYYYYLLQTARIILLHVTFSSFIIYTLQEFSVQMKTKSEKKDCNGQCSLNELKIPCRSHAKIHTIWSKTKKWPKIQHKMVVLSALLLTFTLKLRKPWTLKIFLECMFWPITCKTLKLQKTNGFSVMESIWFSSCFERCQDLIFIFILQKLKVLFLSIWVPHALRKRNKFERF